jgi:dTDP-4-dehydrorhamnose reductase
MKILILGGTGILGKELKRLDENIMTFGRDLDITKFDQLEERLKIIDPDIIMNCAAIKSEKVDLDPLKAIDLNIIGSCNVSKYCFENNKRCVYISTDYIYPGIKGNYSETDTVLPVNNYAWTKLAGEVPVRLVKNHLIIRTSFGNSKFDYNVAYDNLYTSKDYVDIIAPKILKTAKSETVGLMNIGTKRKTIFEYAQERNSVDFTSLTESKDFSLDIKLYIENEQKL